MSQPAGVLIVNKPAGLTSHDVVQHVRRTLKTRKVGHAGTLDPDATGVLVICVGEATRLLEYAAATEKEYKAELVFGFSTDTDDATGQVLESADASHLQADDLRKVLPQFTGVIEQRVPAYSAVHIDGKRAYDMARAGEIFELPVRTVEIRRLEMLSFTSGSSAKAQVTITCSKGTYVRSLCRDVGRQLAVPAHMGALQRTKSGAFGLDEAVDLREWEESADPVQALRPITDAVTLAQLTIADDIALRFAQGQRVWVPAVAIAQEMEIGTVLATTTRDKLAAIVTVCVIEDERWLLQPKKVFWKKDR